MADNDNTTPPAGEPLKREQLHEELEVVRATDPEKILHPEAVVRWAKDHPDSVLHGQFEWDETKAAHAFRVEQARRVIRVVVIQSAEKPRMIRAYVSAPSDRVHGGGYRTVEEGLALARQELLNDALKKLVLFRGQYRHLPELDALFSRITEEVEQFRTNLLTSKNAG